MAVAQKRSQPWLDTPAIRAICELHQPRRREADADRYFSIVQIRRLREPRAIARRPHERIVVALISRSDVEARRDRVLRLEIVRQPTQQRAASGNLVAAPRDLAARLQVSTAHLRVRRDDALPVRVPTSPGEEPRR